MARTTDTSKPATSAAQIVKLIGCEYLSLYRGNGYWYFVYDDASRNIWHDESVPVCYLSQASIEFWVNEGKRVVKEVEEQAIIADWEKLEKAAYAHFQAREAGDVEQYNQRWDIVNAYMGAMENARDTMRDNGRGAEIATAYPAQPVRAELARLALGSLCCTSEFDKEHVRQFYKDHGYKW